MTHCTKECPHDAMCEVGSTNPPQVYREDRVEDAWVGEGFWGVALPCFVVLPAVIVLILLAL